MTIGAEGTIRCCFDSKNILNESRISLAVILFFKHFVEIGERDGLGVELHALTGINEELFDEAKANGVINDAQKDMIMHFLENPADYMTAFLKANPGFIDAEIAKGGKNKERAELAIEKGFTNV